MPLPPAQPRGRGNSLIAGPRSVAGSANGRSRATLLRAKALTYSITFFVAATIDWLIPRFMPGDPVASLVSRTNGISPEAAKALADYYYNLFGLNQPLPVQYLNFWGSLLHGDLGLSVYGHGTPVTDMIMAAVPYTLALLIPAILLSWWAGNTFGALAARRTMARQHRPARRLHPDRDALHVAGAGPVVRAGLTPSGGSRSPAATASTSSRR